MLKRWYYSEVNSTRGFTIIEMLIVVVAILVLIGISFLIYNDHFQNSPNYIQLRSSSIGTYPYPGVPHDFKLVDQSSTNSTSLQFKAYVTNESSNYAVAYVRTICNRNGFKVYPAQAGLASTNNSPQYNDITLQCFKGNDGWQFDISPAWSLKYIDGNSNGIGSSKTGVYIQSIGPAIYN